MKRGVPINEKPNQGLRERKKVGIHCLIESYHLYRLFRVIKKPRSFSSTIVQGNLWVVVRNHECKQVVSSHTSNSKLHPRLLEVPSLENNFFKKNC
jgi:hypothetical protein